MDIAEFLQARSADDEEDADTIHEYGCDTTGAVPFPCNCPIPARLLAECEAKRRIVEMFQRAQAAEVSETSLGLKEVWRSERATLQLVVEYLALPHADHPDYDPTWAP